MQLKSPSLTIETILDSGAFSAWRRGEVIVLSEYIEFIKANKQWISWYVNLDCIPGKPAKEPTEAEKEQAAETSWQNYISMREAGLDPIVVYHKGEHIKWLHKMLDYGCKHIGIGGLVANRNTENRREWLDQVFMELTDSSGRPIVDTHAFGVTAVELLFRYPWTTVDSTRWSYRPGMGSCPVPQRDAKGYRYDLPCKWVEVTHRSQEGKPGTLYNALSPAERAQVDEFLALCGTSVDKLQGEDHDSWQGRLSVCIKYFQFVEASCNCERFDRSLVRRGGFFA